MKLIAGRNLHDPIDRELLLDPAANARINTS
jgi:hypothetical protein